MKLLRAVAVTPKRQQGFTLLEVLISMVILAVGMFGLAGLQVISVRSNSSAYHRSVASMMAYDIMDRMRANPAALKSTVADEQYWNATAWSVGNVPTAPTSSKCTVAGTACTPEDLRNYDLNEWVTADYKLAQLPSASAVITKTNIPSGSANADATAFNIKIAISWNDFSMSAGGFGSSQAETFTYSSIIRKPE